MRVWLVQYISGTLRYVCGVADSYETAAVVAQRHSNAVEAFPTQIRWNGPFGDVYGVYKLLVAKYVLEEQEVVTE